MVEVTLWSQLWHQWIKRNNILFFGTLVCIT